MAYINFRPICSMIILVLVSLHDLLVSCSIPNSKTPSNNNKLLLISFDGFRWNYLDRTSTPNFDRIRKNGVQAVHGLTNAFITKTFPNHFTLVTGLWEESHGIVANYMYDPALNRTFSPHDTEANTDAAWFDQGGEPIWVTNQLQRRDGKSGVLMWVGGGAPVKGVLPSQFVKFALDYKNESKIDTMIKWFKEDACNLGLMYFPQPDRFGHIFGPESEQVTRMIGGLDKVVGYLLDRFEKENLLQNTNIIITSDHGFTSTPVNKAIDVSEFLDLGTFQLESTNPIAGIWPHEGYKDAIYQNLTSAAESMGHFTVYKKEEIPAHFHYSHNRRVPPILVVAEDHYSFQDARKPLHEMGTHGYDNRLQDMHPFFMAMGPDFKSGFTVDTFQSVDVYPLMCHLLGLQPAPNNGSMDIVKALLSNSEDSDRLASIRFPMKHHFGTISVAVLIAAGLSAAALIAVYEMRKRRKERQSTSVIMDDVEITTPDTNPQNSSVPDTNVPLLGDQDF